MAAFGDSTRIRVYNESTHTFTDLVVQTPGARHEFGHLAPRSYSGYREFGESYRYAFISLKIDGVDYVMQPTDYVGETPLGAGKFTFSISVVNPGDRILAIRSNRDRP